MEEQTMETTQNPRELPLCEECKSNPSKYTCPGCSLRSCGLTCVKAHKQRTGCTGKRQQTQFVPISQFDDNLLLSDYNLLEEVKRVAESAQKMRLKLCGNPHFKLPFYLQKLQKAACRRRTRLWFLPSGMSKREKNQSRLDNRKKSISWTVEWRFNSTDIVLLDHRVHENTILCSVVQNHLKPGPWKHQLRQFSENLDSLKFFIRKYPKGKSPYRELDIKAPLGRQLANLVILEYPVIHVFLPSQTCDFEVVKDPIPLPHKPDFNDRVPSPKGIPFKEEEIEEEEGINTDPHVLDLMKNYQGTNSLMEKPIEICNGEDDDGVGSSSKRKKPRVSEGMDFDFEQGLIDAYSDLIAEINPDDFLDFDKDVGDFSSFFAVGEDLEDGEIPWFE